MKHALVIGGAGFAGRYLVQNLAAHGRKVFVATPKGTGGDVIEGCHSVLHVDIAEPDTLDAVFSVAAPDEVYHLAAIATTTGTDALPYFRVNIEGTHHVLQTVEKYSAPARVLVVSSGLVYGECPRSGAVEDAPLHPKGIYAVSKAAADMLTESTCRNGLAGIRARAFNHTGPGQSSSYMVSSITRQVAAIAAGLSEPVIRLGNTESLRDITDVRDVVEAYRVMMECGSSGEAYNVCSGTAWTPLELARLALKVRGVTAEIESDASRRRPGDTAVLVGSPAKLAQLNWGRKYTLEQTLADMIGYWEEQLGQHTS